MKVDSMSDSVSICTVSAAAKMRCRSSAVTSPSAPAAATRTTQCGAAASGGASPGLGARLSGNLQTQSRPVAVSPKKAKCGGGGAEAAGRRKSACTRRESRAKVCTHALVGLTCGETCHLCQIGASMIQLRKKRRWARSGSRRGAAHSERWRSSALESANGSFGAKHKQLTGSAWPAEQAESARHV